MILCKADVTRASGDPDTCRGSLLQLVRDLLQYFERFGFVSTRSKMRFLQLTTFEPSDIEAESFVFSRAWRFAEEPKAVHVTESRDFIRQDSGRRHRASRFRVETFQLGGQ